MCPLHGREFDLSSGEALRGEVGVATYPARLDADGFILLDLPDSGPLPWTVDEDAAPVPGREPPAPPFAEPLERLAE